MAEKLTVYSMEKFINNAACDLTEENGGIRIGQRVGVMGYHFTDEFGVVSTNDQFTVICRSVNGAGPTSKVAMGVTRTKNVYSKQAEVELYAELRKAKERLTG